MSKKELREYTKAGKVVVTNVYKTILPRIEFESQTEDVQRAMMIKWREMYGNDEIMEGLGITGNNTFYKIIERLNIPPKPRGGGKKRGKAKNTSNKKIQVTNTTKPRVVKEDIQLPKGFNLSYSGEYTSAELEKIFNKLSVIVSDDSNRFKLSVTLSEIEEKEIEEPLLDSEVEIDNSSQEEEEEE